MGIAPRPDRVVVINDASVARGGATGLALLSAQLLRRRGLSVTFVCGDAGEAAALTALGIDVVALGAARLLDARRSVAMVNGVWNRAAHQVISRMVFECDTPRTVYHVHGWAQILSPALFAALRPVAPRVITHAHDMFLGCPNGAYMDFRRDTVCDRVPLSVPCVATNCDSRSYAHKLWRVGRHVALQYGFDQRLGWGPVAMIHPAMRVLLERAGLPPHRLVTLRNPASPWRAERIRAEANRGVVFVGRLETGKAVDRLAEAAASTDTPLTIIGDGTQRDQLQARFPQATFCGWLDREAIWRRAAAARALVMPTLLPEPFGLVAAEASLSGLPVILSDRALLAAEVRAGGLGLSYAAADPAGLANALRRLNDMEDAEVARISERGFGRAAPLCSTPEGWIDEMLALYAGQLSVGAVDVPQTEIDAI